METKIRNKENKLTASNILEERYAEKLSLRKAKIQGIISKGRFNSLKKYVNSSLNIDIHKLNLPEQYYKIQILEINFNSLVELLYNKDINIVKFAFASIKDFTLKNLKFEEQYDLNWIKNMRTVMFNNINHQDLNHLN